MMDKQHILLQAGEKALAVDAAKAGVEAAKLALEAARAALDEAKADYDASIEECETAGIPKARARKAIEALNQVWIEAGIIGAEVADPAKDTAAESAPKEPRRRRKGKADSETDTGEATAAAEAAAVPVQEPVEPVKETPADSTPEETPAAAQDAPKAPFDYSVEVSEIDALIDEWCVSDNADAAADVASAKSLLKSLLAGKSWIASNRHEDGFGIEAFRDVLTVRAAAAIAEDGLPDAISKPLADALSAPQAETYLSWFQAILSGLEHGGTDGIVSPFAPAEIPAAALQDEAAPVEEAADDEEVTQASEAVEEDDLPDLPDFDETDYAADAASDFDDNSSFPVSGDEIEDYETEGTVVDDIGEIDFLNDAEENEAPAPAPVETKAPEAEKPAAAPKPAFAPPAFMKRS